MHENNPLKNKFEGFSAEPRPEVWNRIEAELDDKPKRRYAIWWWSAAAVLLTGIGSTFFVKSTSSSANNQVSSIEQSGIQLHSEDNQTQEGIEANHETDSSEIINLQEESSVQSKTSQNVKSSSPKKSSLRSVVSSPKNSPQTNASSDVSNTNKTTSNDHELHDIAVDIKVKPSAIPNHSDTAHQENESQLENPSVIIGDSPIEKDVNNDKKNSKWSLNLNGGIYRTTVYEAYYVNPLFGDLSSGIPITSNEAFQSNLLTFYRHMVHGLGADLAYQLSPKWQLRTSVNLLMYRTKFINESFIQRGSNYFQLAFGGDYTLLQIKRFNWQIGTGIGTGLLRNQVLGGVENHWRSEWNINTALSYSINSKIAIRMQPTSRLIISDTQVGGFGKLSKWYHGGNLGITFTL